MSVTLQVKKQPTQASDKQLFNAVGVIVEFLVSPDEVRDKICLIRGTMPPGVVVPLHNHADPEILYGLSGSLDVFKSNEGAAGWTTAGVGDVVTIPGTVKHALRNSSDVPVTLAVVTKSELYQFFREAAKPFDSNQRPAPRTPQALKDLVAVAAKYGYWIASPEENAAIGLTGF
jgi:quercetin dioxygenase-like cupin family protein